MSAEFSSTFDASQYRDEAHCAQLEKELALLRKQLKRLEQVEQEHLWQTAFLQQFIDMIPMGIAVHTNGVTTYINSAGLAIMRAKNAADILGKPAIEFVHPDFRQKAIDRILALQHAEEKHSFPFAPYVEEKFLCLDGEVIDVEVAAIPLQSMAAESSLLVMFRDVTERKRQQRLLEEREARFRQLVSLLPVATIIHKNGKVFFANQTALDLLRVNSEDAVSGRSVFEFLHPDEHERVRKRMKHMMHAREPLPVINEKIMRADGDIFLAETTVFPFIEDGELAVLVVMRDVTEEERMLKALAKSEAQFRMLAELLPASVFVVNKDGELLYVNMATQSTLDFSTEEASSSDVLNLLDVESLSASKRLIENMSIGESTYYELKIKDKDGKWQWLDVYLTKALIDDEVVGLGVATNATWRKETERLLRQQAQKLVRAYEDERARIARELHDEIGQQLIGMKFVLERAQHFTSSQDGKAALSKASHMLANLTETVRELSLTFRPSQLDDLGLLPTLLWHFERYTDRTGIRVNFNHTGLDTLQLSQTVEITVYRVIQESLTNVARHARTDTVTVSIHINDDRIYLTVADAGIGFEPDDVMTTYVSSGLSGMQERVHLLGGKLTVESAPDRGTTIRAILPVCENPIESSGPDS